LQIKQLTSLFIRNLE